MIVAIRQEGNPKCGHDWISSPMVLTSNPPITTRICSQCGRVEAHSSKIDFHPTFDDTCRKFHGLSERNNIVADDYVLDRW